MKYLFGPDNDEPLAAGFWPDPTNEILAHASNLGCAPGDIRVIDTGQLEFCRFFDDEGKLQQAECFEGLRLDAVEMKLRKETIQEKDARETLTKSREDAEKLVQDRIRQLAIDELEAEGKIKVAPDGKPVIKE
ncbi:MAG: hypothetical protein ABH877_01705 [bacterium]